MNTKPKNNILHSTKEGKLYIKNEDFFRQEKVIDTIHKLMKSDIVKEIEKRRKKEKNYDGQL